MTGNTKVWRAPLAGLASLAMVATMGVAASTAVAAPAAKYTVTYKGGDTAVTSTSVYAGESLADALGGYTTGAINAGSTTFVGWKDADGNYYDFNAPVTGDVTLTADRASDAVKVEFSDINGADQPAFYLPDGANGNSYYVRRGEALGAQRTPADKADGKLVTSWTVDTNSDEGTGTTTQSDLTVQNVYKPEDGKFSIEPDVVATATDGQVAQFKADISNDAAKGHLLGAKSDGDGTAAYVKDVLLDANGKGSATVPAWVHTNTADNIFTPTGWRVSPKGAKYESVTPTVSFDKNGVSLEALDYAKAWTVTFKDTKGATVATKTVADGKYLSDVPDVNNIKVDGYTVKGWKYVSGRLTDSYTDTAYRPGDTVTDWDTAKISGDVVFEAVQGGFTTEVKVTFKDTDYRGSNDPVTTTVKGGEYLDSSKAPSWTRDGYVLAGWTQSDTTDWDWNTLIGDTTLTQKDFTLTAKWVKTDGSVLDAALAYIKGEYTESGTTHPADKAEKYFTSETWGKFETVYQKVQNEKAQLVRASADGKVSDADAARLVSELKAAWEQLKIDAKGNPGLDENGSNAASQNEFVYRLHKDGLRLYSQTPVEIYAAQRTGWTLDNGYLFRAAPKTAAADKYFTKYASFDTAVDEVSSGEDPEYKDDLAAKLDAVADPILNQIERYSSPNGTDWVYTSNPTEQASLKRGGWNHEGTAFVVPTFGGTPVVRFALNGQHLMSTGVTEQNALVRAGWTREGVAFRAL